MRNSRYSNFYFLMILALTSLFVTSAVYMCDARAQSKKAPAQKQLVIAGTPCGKAITPVLGLLLASGKLAEEEREPGQDEWYTLIVGGNMALIDVFTKTYPKGTVPAVYAWKATHGLVGFIMETMTVAPRGHSAGMFVQALSKLYRANEVCEQEAASAESSQAEKNRRKQNSVSL